MEKTIRFILITLAIGIASVTVNHTALAKKEIKLIGVEEGNNNEHLTSDIIGDSVIMGARGAGVATIYVNDGKNWKKQQDLLASDPNAARAATPSYSHSVAIGAPHEFAAANFAIIGAPRHLHGGDQALAGKGGYGVAYIFRRSGKNWKQQIKLTAPDPMLDDRFGEAVAIYRSTAVVGASKDDDNGKNSGSVFVYAFDGESWKPQAKIVPDDLVGSDAFGEAVSLDENTLAIGAPGHTHSGVRFAGAVYVYVREDG
ncbi:MAG: FG-GAP repeat protein [Candidatus Poribacteria bacterium]|nr:FG-GAP repeat protein [Candidatus Poribacteria bacterium]MDE0505365.1 FG-GAP repeat protein [Candidatus Poribacteria bacterium]